MKYIFEKIISWFGFQVCNFTVALTITSLIFFCPAGASAAENPNDILIVVNNKVAVSAVSIGEVRDIFLKNKTHWSASQKALPINSKDSALRDDFRSRVLKMNSAAEERHWRDAKVRDNKTEPASFGDSLKAVFKLPGAIGYVYRKDYNSSAAKVVLVIPK